VGSRGYDRTMAATNTYQQNLDQRHVCILYAGKSKVAWNGEMQVPLRQSSSYVKGPSVVAMFDFERETERERERERENKSQ